MRILGVDPGLQVTGYGVIEQGNVRTRLVEAGVIRTTASLALPERLRELATEMSAILTQLRPDLVAIEELYSHYDHPTTAIIMGHARGVVALKAAEAGLPVISYAATRIKKSLTGNGRASKVQMQAMVSATFGLSGRLEPPDAADALAVALCHSRTAAGTASLT